MQPAVLNELRLLTSVELDSRMLLAVVLAGDSRLTARFRYADLLPLGSRIRVRLNLESASPEELAECLRHSMAAAGNPRLMTKELVTTLADHATGNHRVLMSLASELLAQATQRDLEQLDEKLYFDVFTASKPRAAEQPSAAAGRSRRHRE